MNDINTDEETAKVTPIEDRGESLALMEPLSIRENDRHQAVIADLAIELTARSSGLRRSLPKNVTHALSDLVRSMDCYYSNLIEGHDTHPVDIERALNEDFSEDPVKRDLQLEARAHIAVQQWIDQSGLEGKATTVEGINGIHSRFCELLPEELLWIENPDTRKRIKMAPGVCRNRDVKVGQHVPISPGALPRFMARFEQGYSGLGKMENIIASATAHHRLLWMHPFLDGNGRVARLMSYSMLRDTLDTGGIWSIARGLARNESQYKAHLIACDLPRRNDLDGRGHLSEEALAEFTQFFLKTCVGQVAFMEELIRPDRLKARISTWVEEEAKLGALPLKSGLILDAVLYRGELPRNEVGKTIGASERTARRVTSTLIDRGVLVSDSRRASLRLAFPATLAARWMPGLFPDQE